MQRTAQRYLIMIIQWPCMVQSSRDHTRLQMRMRMRKSARSRDNRAVTTQFITTRGLKIDESYVLINVVEIRR